MTRTWMFGEAEYESSETFQENYDRLFHTAESCGYMIDVEISKIFRVIILDGSDLEHVRMTFMEDKISKIKKWQYTDRTGEMELQGEETLVIN